jgi:NAD(P)-dependent dehydrogenase (short-subunit alcohol dehydrogenase family)
MAGRVDGKIAIVVGGGQTPGHTIGNGRATALLLAREGATVLVADRYLESAQDTVDLIVKEGGAASACAPDITQEDEIRALIDACMSQHGRIDILHNNVGVSVELGDAPATDLPAESFDAIVAINLRGMWLTCKHALPQMQSQESGSIVNISSMAARLAYPGVAYKTTKIAVIGLTENLAAANAGHGIRVNVILPGLMNTPMAIENRVANGADRDDLIAQRDSQVPLGRKMGTGWDVANAALFLHSDDASFITGVALPVDGGSALTR